MEETNNQNSTYTIEEKSGKIVKVEDLQEKHRQQKETLKAILIPAIASLCGAIIVNGAIAFSNHKENNNTATQTIITEEMSNSNVEKNSAVVTTVNEGQINNMTQMAQQDTTDYYNQVLSYYETNGNSDSLPNELQNAYINLGMDNFNLAKQTGVYRYATKNQTTDLSTDSMVISTTVNEDQINNMTQTAQQEATNYYNQVLSYYETHGNSDSLPDELQNAYINLGNDNFNLAKQTGVYRNVAKNNLSIYQQENKVGDEWQKGNIMVSEQNTEPMADMNTRYVFLGTIPSNNSVLYQKEVRSVSIDSLGNPQVNSDWQRTSDIYIGDSSKMPTDTIDTRYVPIWSSVKTNANVNQPELEENMQKMMISDEQLESLMNSNSTQQLDEGGFTR